MKISRNGPNRSNLSRRDFVRLSAASAGVATLAALAAPSALGFAPATDASKPAAAPPRIQTKIETFALRHGGVKPVRHERLQVEVNSQTSVVTLRFYRPARVDRVEIPVTVYGRGSPAVPCHPAHLLVSIFNRNAAQWEVVREVELPANPKFSGQGLSLDAPMKEMEAFFQNAVKEQPPYSIELGGLETDHLRLECDREHPVYPNEFECNGNVYQVPFGIFREVVVYGEPLRKRPAVAPYHRILRRGPVDPVAPPGMAVRVDGRMILFRSSRLAIGFSLYRPVLLHLGWDDLGQGRAELNRLLVSRTLVENGGRILPLGGLSGPLLRTLDFDVGSHLWTGRLEVKGNEVRYLGLHATDDLLLDVIFTVEADRIQMEVEETCRAPLAAVEYEAWRFAWDARSSPTGVSGVPSEQPGRNGHLPLPVYLAGEGSGCLSLRRTDEGGASGGDPAHLQMESYRESEALTCGLVPVARAADGFGVIIPVGTRKTRFELAVANLQPRRWNPAATEPLSAGVRRHWATLFSCYRPEYRGFSNNCMSVNCHLAQWSELEVLAHTDQPKEGPDLIGMLRFTLEKAFLDGGGYGYWREYFMDSDPSLLCALGTLYRIDPQRPRLERIRPGLNEVFDRMTALAGDNGLLVNLHLSGNSGEFTRSTNGIDTVSFGFLDAYSNAWAYRGLRNAAPLFAVLGDGDRAAKAIRIAGQMRQSYGPTFINPKTGWVSGWRSRDGQLHDFGYTVINGMAIAFGLLDDGVARNALAQLENLRRETCPVSAELGLPINLIPTAYDDQYLPQILGGSQPTYEIFTDGAMSTNLMEYYLRALAQYGFRNEARQLAAELDRGFAEGFFSGGIGSGNESRSWDGIPTGYEGTLICNFGLLYAIAVEKGFIKPREPEWWPAMP